MTEIAHPIKINLPAKLQDREYRQRFFLAESSARLAEQITTLRKRRGLNQKQLAEMVDTKQPAISRVEQADYQNWNFGTVQKIVGALDGRIRVIIQASEDVLPEYEEQAEGPQSVKSSDTQIAASNCYYSLFLGNTLPTNWPVFQFATGVGCNRVELQLVNSSTLLTHATSKVTENARLEIENARLRQENLALKAAIGGMHSLPDNRPTMTNALVGQSLVPAIPLLRLPA
jgi:transcriptional regulator with XRE-family HTH domain